MGDVATYTLGLVIGGILVVVAFVRGGPWGIEPTIGLVVSLLSGMALLRGATGSGRRREQPGWQAGHGDRDRKRRLT